ncbi:MAG: tripartite tricarboxylate transporter substrate binding protein [Bordetella sp.]|nr:tripartite tricarboxylate transporter substrate binding protein [Bordetella sp.]
MNAPRRWTRRAACIATTVAAIATFASGAPLAQERGGVTRILVPFVAGGATDIVARQLAMKLGEMWAAQVIVENKPGAAGTLASRQLVAAAPDGKTLIMVTSGHAINELIYDKLPYDTLKDFTPITQVTEIANVLLTTSDGPYKSVADVLADGKANPELLSYGTAGIGTSVHLAGEMLSATTGVKLTPVHFKGDGESIVALAGGHIPLSINTIPGAKAQVAAGKVRPLAVTTATRFSQFKDVPTMAEAGVPGYAVSNWFGVLGPAKMDPAVVAKLNADIRKALADTAVQKHLEDAGITVKTGSAEEFDGLIRADIAKWRPIVSKLDLTGS